jgi:MFS family permease
MACAAASPRNAVLQRVFKAFQYRDFRLMWTGAFTSSVGTWMQQVAQDWLIYRLTGDPFLLGVNQALATIPIFLFSLIGGVVADRVERRYILSGSQYVQMACAGALTLLLGTGHIHVWHVLVCSFIAGTAQAFGGPAWSALIPTLVDEKDMPNAIALMSIQFNGAVMLGPAAGAAILAKIGETWCFGLNTVSFLAPIVALAMLKVRFLPTPTSENMINSLKEGVRFIRRQGAMEALIILAFLMTFLSIPMRTFLLVFAKDIFHRGAGTYALFLSISGMGSIAGALSIAGLGNIKSKGRVALGALTALGASGALFAVSRSVPFSCVTLFVSGAAMMAVFAAVNSLVQLIVSNDMRGRVVSVYNFAFRGGMTMGNLASGWFVPIYSAPVVIGVNGLLLIAVAGYFALTQRRVAAL